MSFADEFNKGNWNWGRPPTPYYYGCCCCKECTCDEEADYRGEICDNCKAGRHKQKEEVKKISRIKHLKYSIMFLIEDTKDFFHRLYLKL